MISVISMKISNLHLEHAMPFEYGHLQTRIICDIESNFTDVKHLWFSVDEHYSASINVLR